MPPYQLLLAEALVGATIISSFVLFLARSKEHKIHLPTTQDASLADDVNQDPFNVTKPEDFIDGEPIDEGTFWVKVSIIMRFVQWSQLVQMRHRKLLLVLLSAVILALEGISLGWSAYTNSDGHMLAEHVLRTEFALYVGV